MEKVSMTKFPPCCYACGYGRMYYSGIECSVEDSVLKRFTEIYNICDNFKRKVAPVNEFINSLPIPSVEDGLLTGIYKGHDLVAPMSFWNAEQDTIDEMVGGCGPGGLGDMLVPDTLYGLSVTEACVVHDWCFGVWDDPNGFVIANTTFLMNMEEIVKKKGGWLKWLRLRRAKKYYLAVKLGGKKAYKG